MMYTVSPELKKRSTSECYFLVPGKYLGLAKKDSGVAIPSSLVVVDNTVYGCAFDSKGGVTQFSMPLDVLIDNYYHE